MEKNYFSFIAIMFIAMLATLAVFIDTELRIGKMEVEVRELREKKQGLEIENTNLKEKLRIEIIPEVIDCEKEIGEGDIKVEIKMKMYNPFGEWIEITEDNVEYQLKYGGRIIQCLEMGGEK